MPRKQTADIAERHGQKVTNAVVGMCHLVVVNVAPQVHGPDGTERYRLVGVRDGGKCSDGAPW